MLFEDFVRFCEKLEKTKSRLEKVSLIVDFLKSLSLEEVAPAVWFLTGTVFSPYSDLKLDVGWALIQRALRDIKSGQLTLVAGKPSILDVYNTLVKIAKIKGENSRTKKELLLKSLFKRMSLKEIEYLLRAIFGEVRVGASEGLVLEAVAKLAGCSDEEVRRAYMFLADLGELARIAREKGAEGIRSIKLELFRPVKPMLAEMEYDIRKVLRECGGIAAFEFKYDGIRLQIHKKGDKVKLFTRRLTDVTDCLPDVIDQVKKYVKADSVVLDSEAISFKDGKPVRFQDLMRRLRRKYGVQQLMREIPLQVKIFDVLYLNGEILVDKPYKERWQILEKIVDKSLLAERIISSDLLEVKKFLEASEKAGHEGLMAKRLDSPYTPGVRGKYWFKVKPADTLDLVIVAAEWGHGRRRGWLSDYYLAVRDEETGEFLVVGKTFKGLTDEEFKEMTKKLLELKVAEEGWVVKVKPQIVVEVAYNEIQRSPKYRSGFALRFARIVRIRWDKSPYEVTTLQELKRKYEEQFEKKAKITK